MRKKCSVKGCIKNCRNRHKAGLCHAHYVRFRRNGHTDFTRRANGTGGMSRGYICMTVGRGGKKKMQHILVAEKVLGKKLPKGAVVHHVDRNRQNNKPNNLVVCPNQAYHLLLHKRMRDQANGCLKQ